MATQREEIVLHADWADTQRLAPDACHAFFDLIARCEVGRVQLGAWMRGTRGLGLAECRSQLEDVGGAHPLPDGRQVFGGGHQNGWQPGRVEDAHQKRKCPCRIDADRQAGCRGAFVGPHGPDRCVDLLTHTLRRVNPLHQETAHLDQQSSVEVPDVRVAADSLALCIAFHDRDRGIHSGCEGSVDRHTAIRKGQIVALARLQPGDTSDDVHQRRVQLVHRHFLPKFLRQSQLGNQALSSQVDAVQGSPAAGDGELQHPIARGRVQPQALAQLRLTLDEFLGRAGLEQLLKLARHRRLLLAQNNDLAVGVSGPTIALPRRDTEAEASLDLLQRGVQLTLHAVRDDNGRGVHDVLEDEGPSPQTRLDGCPHDLQVGGAGDQAVPDHAVLVDDPVFRSADPAQDDLSAVLAESTLRHQRVVPLDDSIAPQSHAGAFPGVPGDGHDRQPVLTRLLGQDIKAAVGRDVVTLAGTTYHRRP